MKTAVSIPDDVFQAAEQMAHRLDYSRSRLFTEAVCLYLDTRGGDSVTAALNDVYDGLEAPTPNVGRQLIDAGEWQW